MSTQPDPSVRPPWLARLRLNVSRLLRRKALTIPAAIAVLTRVLVYLDVGTKVVDWAARYDYLKGRAGVLFDVLRWLLSPRGLDFLFIVALVVLLIAIIVIVNSSVGESPGPVTRKANSKDSRVEILAPLDGRNVGWRQIVRGSVFPPDSEVQVLVNSPDGLWYVQEPVVVRGSSWSCRCQFGDKGKPGHAYKVGAVFGKPLKSTTYEELRDGLTTSQITTVNRSSDEDIIDCPDKQLHQIRINDKNAIKKWVKVCFVRCEPHIDVPNDERQFVDFRFCIVNLSLFEVSIESVLGYITFIKVALDEAIKLEGALKLEKNERALNRGFRSEGWFTVRQYLPDYQVRAVAGAPKESIFYFHNLKILISGEGFDPVDLDVPAQVQKGISWNAQDAAAEYVFVSEAERQAKIRELQVERDLLKSHMDENASLRKIARIDREQVERVVFAAVRVVDFNLLDSEGRIDIIFDVFNGSLFPVSLSARINGWVHHGGRELSQYAVIEVAQSDDLPRGEHTVFTIRQEGIPVDKRKEVQDELQAGGVEFDLLPIEVGIRVTDAAGTGRVAHLQIPEGIICRTGIRVNLKHSRVIFETAYPIPSIE
jgi:hypothetical protein